MRGYRTELAGSRGLELVAGDLSFPTSMTFAPDGALYVAEAGLGWGGAPSGGRIWKVKTNGTRTLVADGLRDPVTGSRGMLRPYSSQREGVRAVSAK